MYSVSVHNFVSSAVVNCSCSGFHPRRKSRQSGGHRRNLKAECSLPPKQKRSRCKFRKTRQTCDRSASGSPLTWKFSSQEVANWNVKILSRRLHLAGMVYYEDPLLSKSAWGKRRTRVNNAKRLPSFGQPPDYRGRKVRKESLVLLKKVRKISNFVSKSSFKLIGTLYLCVTGRIL
jgi:hypothetical protein